MSNTQKERVWLALSKAAERIASREYAAGHYKPTRRGGKVVQGYRLSEAHQTVLDAMNALGRDEITPEEAMAVLHEHDVMQARTGRTATKRKRSYKGRSKSVAKRATRLRRVRVATKKRGSSPGQPFVHRFRGTDRWCSLCGNAARSPWHL